MSELTEQNPELAAFFEANAKDWDDWNQDAAICKALEAIDDHGYYELAGVYTNTTNPVIYKPESVQ